MPIDSHNAFVATLKLNLRVVAWTAPGFLKLNVPDFDHFCALLVRYVRMQNALGPDPCHASSSKVG